VSLFGEAGPNLTSGDATSPANHDREVVKDPRFPMSTL